jgi:putative colanic acid biosysnthesis UDP-glucose lipid carrier transferase
MEDKYYSRLVKVLIFIIDFYLIQLVFSVVKQSHYASEISTMKFTSFLLTFSLLWIIAGFANEVYLINKFSLLRSILKSVYSTTVLHVVLMAGVLLFTDFYRFHIIFFVSVYALTASAILFMRLLFKATWKYFEANNFDQRKVIIIGTTRTGKALYNFFNAHEYSHYKCKGFFDDRPDSEIVFMSIASTKTSLKYILPYR